MSRRINKKKISKLIETSEITLLSLTFATLLLNVLPSWAEESGITEKVIRIGASDPLEGDTKAYGQNLKKGIDAALTGQTIQKHTIEFEMLDDRYMPEKSVENTKQLINKGVFAMVGSFGSATDTAGEFDGRESYAAPALGAKEAKADRRVLAQGRSVSQASTRATFTAMAVNTC